jgi:DNA primase
MPPRRGALIGGTGKTMLPNSVAMKTNNQYEVRYCCPSCSDEGFHLYYNIRKNLFHCFKCGYRGRKTPERAYTEDALTEMFDILQGKKEITEAQYSVILPPCDYVRKGSLAMRYMLNRGIPVEKVNAMGCMVSNDPKFENRIIIPVYGLDKAIVFYQARSLLKSLKPKYLNPISPKKGAVFYNMGRAIQGRIKHLFITEGIFKALKFWPLDLPAIAIFGKELTKEQVNKVWAHTKEATIILDPDAFNFALRMKDQMEVMKPWGHLRVINSHKAPDDMTVNELKELLEEVEAHEILSDRLGSSKRGGKRLD